MQSRTESNSLVSYKSQPISKLRSEQLNVLTGSPSGLPTLHVALDPANFPFIESAKQCRAENHGVVKLGNVCTSCSIASGCC